jgi:hypothetical protein
MDRELVARELLLAARSLVGMESESESVRVAREIRKVARNLVAIEFDSEEALKKYLSEHPKANKSKHSVKKGEPSKGQEMAPDKKAPKKEVTPKGQEKAPAKHKEYTQHDKVKPSVKSLAKVKNVLDANDIDEDADELHEMTGFKKTLGQRIPEAKQGQFYVRNEAKLKADFLAHMNPANYDSPEAFKNAKERIRQMPTSDFGKVLAAISEEEGEA